MLGYIFNPCFQAAVFSFAIITAIAVFKMYHTIATQLLQDHHLGFSIASNLSELWASHPGPPGVQTP